MQILSIESAVSCFCPWRPNCGTKKQRWKRGWRITSCSKVSNCWSAFTNTCSWYFLLLRIRRAFCLSPRLRASLASSFSRFSIVCIRFEYWCNLSRCILRSSIARSINQRSFHTINRSREPPVVLLWGIALKQRTLRCDLFGLGRSHLAQQPHTTARAYGILPYSINIVYFKQSSLPSLINCDRMPSGAGRRHSHSFG